MLPLPKGTILLATADDERGMTEALSYIKQHGLNRDMVKLTRFKGDSICIEARVDIILRG